jgi:uncharacterized protein (TIGR03435 family)
MPTPYRHQITTRFGKLLKLSIILFALAQSACVFPLAPAQNAQTKPEAPKRMPADADPSFEVVTVKPSSPDEQGSSIHAGGGHLTIKNHTLNTMLLFAYGIHPKQIVDAPAWFATDRYDVDGVLDTEGEPNLKQMQRIVQKMLAERFELKLDEETRELLVYALMVAKEGPKLTKSKGDPNVLGDENDNMHSGQITQTISNMSMTDFTLIMQFFTDRPVVDQTGLAGKWDFKWTWTQDESRVSLDANAPPGMFTAIQEQLGLKLEAKKAPADVFVIDHIERPSAN